eukprot:sb/3469951/
MLSTFATKLYICSVHNCHKLRGTGASPQSFIEGRDFLTFKRLKKEWLGLLGLTEKELKRSCPMVCSEHFRIEDTNKTAKQIRVIAGRLPVDVINGERVTRDSTRPDGSAYSIVETDPESPFVDKTYYDVDVDDDDDDDNNDGDSGSGLSVEALCAKKNNPVMRVGDFTVQPKKRALRFSTRSLSTRSMKRSDPDLPGCSGKGFCKSGSDCTMVSSS